MKIGIYLGYGPQVSFVSEGLGRYLGTLIKGFLETNQEVTICCPKWLVNSLDELFLDMNINKETVHWITTSVEPPLWRLFLFFNDKKRKGMIGRFVDFVAMKSSILFEKWERFLAETRNTFLFYTVGILGFVLGIICFVPCLIIKLANTINYLLSKLSVDKKGVLKQSSKINRVNSIFQRMKKWLLISIPIKIFFIMVNAEQKQLLMKINKMKNKVDLWFVPSLFWPQVNAIKDVPIVINAPDLVTREFPFGFGDIAFQIESINACQKTLREGRFFITYCDYIKRALLHLQYKKKNSQVIALPHANNEMASYLRLQALPDGHENGASVMDGSFARSLLGKYGQVRYIFYASQARPNKNMLNLIKAYEYLLRKRFIPIKLFVTGYLPGNLLLHDYIQENHLENEIIEFHNVPAQKLAALYYCAELVVNPTLYEGGFPFTFGEGMSVGTPSIMGDIPQTREVLEPAGLEEIMFDPHDWRAMADKIEYALNHKKELYEKELSLYLEMAKRTPAVEAADYVKAFQYFIEQDRQMQNSY